MKKLKNLIIALIKNEWAVLAAIIFLGLVLRLYGVTLPLVDSHQVRQAQTAMMAQNLYEDNINIFRTRLDIFGNSPGYIILEFPLMHAIVAFLYNLFGVHEIFGRLVSIVFSIGAMFLMYGLARKFLSVTGALAALALYTFSPMNIFFSRAFMPESSMMFFMIGAIYFFLKWLDRRSLGLYIGAIIFAGFACLTKPTAALIFAPIFTAWFLKERWEMAKSIYFWVYMILALAPGFLWAVYANYFNALNPDIPSTFGGNWIALLKAHGMISHWFSLKFYAFLLGSVSLLLLTPLGFIGALSGVLCAKESKLSKVLYLWLAVFIVYFYALSGPNSGHIYYHLPLLPLAVIFFGFSIEWLLGKRELIKKILEKRIYLWICTVFILLTLVSYGIGYFWYFKYMYENRMLYTIEAAEIIKKHTPENRFVIVNQDGILLSVFSYYSHSKSCYFTVRDKSIDELEYWRSKGATTFVALDTNYEKDVVRRAKENEAFWRYLNENYKPVAITDHYFIFDLRNPIRLEKK